MGNAMNASNLVFPIVCFSQGIFEVVRDFDTLTSCNKLAVKRGWYHNMLIVDSDGKAVRVASAEKLHGVGPCWGYNIFLNQRIRVKLSFAGKPYQMSVVDLRKRVLDSVNTWHGWQTRDDFNQWKTAIKKASTIAEIVSLIAT